MQSTKDSSQSDNENDVKSAVTPSVEVRVGTPSKKDRQSNETRRAIIEAAESLFGEHGIDGVSLRQIGATAGSSNMSVVAYHFGNKEALIEAIYDHRLPTIDARRGELLQQAIADGVGENCSALLRALWLPLLEQRSSNGRHGFARFLSSISKSGMADTRYAVSDRYPHTDEIAKRLGILVNKDSQDLRQLRLHMQFVILAGVIEQIDAHFHDNPEMATIYFNDGLKMASSALTATE